MSLLKSSFDGIGTGAGVAWPLFGILSSSLGLAAGSVLTIVAGSIASLLFCAVAGLVFYISLNNARQAEKKAEEKLKLKIEELCELTYFYLQSVQKNVSLNLKAPEDNLQILEGIKKQIELDLKNCDRTLLISELLEQLLFHPKYEGLLRSLVTLSYGEDEIKFTKTLKGLISGIIRTEVANKRPSTMAIIQTAFLSMVGTFGAIAGCTAGFMGLLSGLGLLAGFSAVPIVGWATLLIAITLATVVAVNSIERLDKQYVLKAATTNVKNMHKNMYELYVSEAFKVQARNPDRIQLLEPPNAGIGVTFFSPLRRTEKNIELITRTPTV
ncbi:hypothetical protein [Legionella jordanis]|uniref:Uncharacterized protein n=1 Tax=Legionella jordanis TaxID=456 RepID=A0A0W0V7U8_9GAMM|nr:hypothetical protein [Legionella jordanis]KTD16154.1 hypothetical protein Ljor_0460 [Legionella jordanis]RMX04620.1 hypothetical protein EAW55_04070 [Legionella jordanis]RMX18329.1 hypothetical protein EAS68_08255 [Legionella jordanis]VEH12386.1 Uncharacterised protein [Legionella jordanis]HAT8713899.1 hypothetical protein [Legionella jordanis]